MMHGRALEEMGEHLKLAEMENKFSSGNSEENRKNLLVEIRWKVGEEAGGLWEVKGK
jgi:hypothetical protein